ncbi:UNVERIFIED_CONTAM: Metal-nicotianamine transporter YSL3 [Sesamum angustifolium]|uniref:Metal-nicotianamine transporter YSL3 n=1 Tax=Sesamum angustifolium TaxID=2727405 RepID=A0AAW2PRA4_9LAMI
MEIQREDLEEMRDQQEDLKRIPSWKEQITIRGIIASLLIGIIYSIIENTIIQTCAVACYSIAVGGGFGSYLLGLNKRTYEQAGVDTEGNSPGSYKEPGLDWMIGFLFVVSFVGLLALVPLRKIMIIDYKLPYPSGTATAVLINGFHTSKGDKMAKKQVRGFVKFFSLSFIWSFFQWFYSGGVQCGFINFPTFGLRAWKQTFYFDFSMTYVGAGMICSHLVNLSLLVGAVLSWGVMWPLISEKKGDWFAKDIKESSMKSLNGYKVFISIALILGDGLYNFLKTLFFTVRSMYSTFNKKNLKADNKTQTLDDLQRNEVFIRESIPMWLACTGYMFFSIISIIVIPIMFPQLKWYYVLVAYMLAPSLSFCNAYGAGLTDMNMAYNYGKVALFVLAALAGKDNGVVAGLIGCGLIKSIVSISSDLMHDFKTGHLTLTSPRSMLISQAIGTAIGCIVAPLSFFLFYKAFDVGNPDGDYKAPYALIYRNMAILGVEGFSALPHHCLQLCYGFFAFAVLAIFERRRPREIRQLGSPPNGYGRAVSCLICGDGLWILPSSILALAKINPPICMSFLPTATT